MTDDRRRTACRPWPTCASWSSACGSPPRRRRRCWPTGAPTSSRWSRRRATPCGSAFGSLGIGAGLPQPGLRARTTGGSAASCSTCASPRPGTSSRSCSTTADVFVTNLRPDALDGLGLEPAATVARHPRLVYCSVSGYGLRGDGPQPARLRHRRLLGPLRACRCSWPTARACRSTPAAASATTSAGSPRWPGCSPPCSSSARPGAAGSSRCRCCEPAPTCSGWDLSLQATPRQGGRAEPRHANQTPLMNSYRAADGRWFFFTGLEADRHIDKVYRALGPRRTCSTTRASPTRAALRKHRDRGHRRPRRDHRRTSRSTCGPSGSTREGVWWAPAQTPAEVLEDPQLLANDGSSRSRRSAEGRAALRQRSGQLLRLRRAARRAGAGASASTPTRCWPSSAGGPAASAALGQLPRARASRPRAMTSRWISLVPSPMTMSGASR